VRIIWGNIQNIWRTSGTEPNAKKTFGEQVGLGVVGSLSKTRLKKVSGEQLGLGIEQSLLSGEATRVNREQSRTSGRT